jgi:lysine 2,3-aminomutase
MSAHDPLPRRLASGATLRSADALVAAGLADAATRDALDRIAARYAIAITPELAALIDPADPADPIARQFVPDVREADTAPGEQADPIGDARHTRLPGLIHRYPDRVLLKVTHACPVYCRFCFRREVVGPGGAPPLGGQALEDALAYIAARPAIFEVILTGGDPLMLAPRRIAEITTRLAQIAHVAVIRWHTRVPLVDPARVGDELVAALLHPAKAVYVGLHANHAREFSPAGRAAIAKLADAGIALVSQTVLLKGINDDAATLETLMRTFLANRVKPYYLHHMDPAPGTAHHRTTIAHGQEILRQLRGRLSGLAQPTYVLDIAGGVAKVPVGPGFIAGDTIIAPDGSHHPHPDAERG